MKVSKCFDRQIIYKEIIILIIKVLYSNVYSSIGLGSISALRLHFEVLLVLQTKPDGHL